MQYVAKKAKIAVVDIECVDLANIVSVHVENIFLKVEPFILSYETEFLKVIDWLDINDLFDFDNFVRLLHVVAVTIHVVAVTLSFVVSFHSNLPLVFISILFLILFDLISFFNQ